MPSKIEWTDETWNVTTGCTKVSVGCDRCYAERMARRQVAMGFARHERGSENDDTWIAYGNAIDPDTGRWSGEITCRWEKLREPLHWKRPRKIFVNSMSDLFHKDVPDQFLNKIWRTFRLTPQHTYLILTKRPRRMLSLMKQAETWSKNWNFEFPLPNVWLGVTAENQAMADERIPILLQTPAAIHYVSLEPLLGGINLKPYLPYLDLVIVGGETGPGARPMRPGWARSIRDQCTRSGTSLFFKGWGAWLPFGQRHAVWNAGAEYFQALADRLGGTDRHQVQPGSNGRQDFYRVGKAESGRLLDGRTWDEMPVPQGT